MTLFAKLLPDEFHGVRLVLVQQEEGWEMWVFPVPRRRFGEFRRISVEALLAEQLMKATGGRLHEHAHGLLEMWERDHTSETARQLV